MCPSGAIHTSSLLEVLICSAGEVKETTGECIFNCVGKYIGDTVTGQESVFTRKCINLGGGATTWLVSDNHRPCSHTCTATDGAVERPPETCEVGTTRKILDPKCVESCHIWCKVEVGGMVTSEVLARREMGRDKQGRM